MNYDTLVRLVENKSVVKVLLDTKNVSKWSVHQKWIVHDFIKIHSRELDLTIDSSSMTKGIVINKSQWCNLVIEYELKTSKEMIRSLLRYYSRVIEYVEENGGWQYVEYYLKSRGMAASLSSMHSVDLDSYIERVDELSEDQKETMKYLDESKLCILAGPGAGKTTTLVHIVRELLERNNRVLVLMFNVTVKDQFVKRLKELGVTNVLKHPEQKHFSGKHARDIIVCTIHKYLYECMPYPVKKSSGGKVTFGAHNAKYMAPYSWDYCVVDEVQDLDRNLYDGAIKLVNSRHFIYAGDYRQNIAGDSDVFQRILSSSTKVCKIRDNYRSYPDIVDILNVYSESNYSDDVHISQTGMIENDTNNGKNPLVIEQCTNDDIAHRLVEHLLQYKPGETFIIAPISINKYNYMDIKERVYNILLSNHRDRYRHLHVYNPAEYKSDDMSLRSDKDYFITAKSAKGLERKQVIVYNVSDIGMYCSHEVYRRIDEESIVSHLYVAMSRPTHRLVILLDDRYRDQYKPYLTSTDSKSHPLSQVFKSIDYTPVSNMTPHRLVDISSQFSNRISQNVSVTNMIKHIKPDTRLDSLYNVQEIASFKPVSVLKEHTFQQSDLIGIYVEACIADHYGCLKNTHVCIGTYDDIPENSKDMYIYRVERKANMSNEQYSDMLKRHKDYAAMMSKETDKRYAYVAMKIFHKLGKYDSDTNNMIGELFKNQDPDISGVVTYIDTSYDGDDSHAIEHHVSKVYDIHADRSSDSGDYSTRLYGEADLIHGDTIYEIKHSSSEDSLHYAQVLLYGMIMKKNNMIVINTKRGKVYRVTPKNDSVYSLLERIIRANAHVSWSTKFPQTYCKDSDLFGPNIKYILSVDDEYRSGGGRTNYYERAIVVYDVVEKTVVDALQIQHKDARENTSVPIVASRENCHRYHNDDLVDDPSMDQKYHEFLSKYRPECSVIMHWAGSEGNNYDFSRVSSSHPLHGYGSYTCIDMRKIYDEYLYNIRNISSPEEKHSSLDGAIQDLFGQSMHLLYHRAYDDSIATLLVYVSLTSK